MKYVPDEDDATTQGLFGWLGDLASDIVSGVGAALTWMVGGAGSFYFSGGGNIFIQNGGEIYYTYGSGGFKLEPGMEEDPRVWY